MNLLSFISSFPDEITCKAHFKSNRVKHGVVCKRCEGTSHKWRSSKEQFECTFCKFRTTLKSGTMLENSKLPFRYWYIAVHLMSSTKKGFSAHEMRRQIGHKRYEPIWNMMHKIRRAMGNGMRDLSLKGMVELDDAYVTTHTTAKEKLKTKRGKGSTRKSKITVFAESTPLEIDNKIEKACGKFYMSLNTSESAESIDQLVKQRVSPDTVLFTDHSKAYVNLSALVEQHLKQLSSDGEDFVYWVHIAISNLKRNILGIYHFVKQEYLQNYLDEFVYRLNQRKKKCIFNQVIVDLIR